MPHIQRAVILLHPQAPAKPPAGAACNGCGVCCAFAPCPMGMLLSRQRTGACKALEWAGDRYVCGVLATPGRYLPWVPAAWARRLAGRWIAAGRGCDADLDVG